MSAAIDAIVRDRVMNFLIPLFLQAAEGDADRARQAVECQLDGYAPRTPRELRLAALAIAFSFGALDALARCANQDATISQVLRLRGSASTLARAADKAELAIEAERAEPVAEETAAAVELPASIDIADLIRFNKSNPPLSRQQRRLAERHLEKQRRRLEDLARQSKQPTAMPSPAAQAIAAAAGLVRAAAS